MANFQQYGDEDGLSRALSTSWHPTELTLQRYAEELLDAPDDRVLVASHLAVCADCDRKVRYVAAALATLRSDDEHPPAPAPGMLERVLERILGTLGATPTAGRPIVLQPVTAHPPAQRH